LLTEGAKETKRRSSAETAGRRKKVAATPLPPSVSHDTATTAAPPEKPTDQGRTASPALGNSSSPSLWRFVLLPACGTNSVLHAGEWGENNSPRQFCCWARLVLAQPCLLAGPGPEGDISFLGRYRPNPFLGRNRPNTFGLSPTQLVGQDQPSPFNIIYYILYLFWIIYVCMF